jgi:hypothetical protein
MSKIVFEDMNYIEYLHTDLWKSRRAKAIRSAGYHCQVAGCQSMDLHLHVHHRNYERLEAELDSDLQVLCAKHHALSHGKE